jgi:hypothetical protein
MVQENNVGPASLLQSAKEYVVVEQSLIPDVEGGKYFNIAVIYFLMPTVPTWKTWAFFKENMVGALPFHYKRNNKWYSYKPGRTGHKGNSMSYLYNRWNLHTRIYSIVRLAALYARTSCLLSPARWSALIAMF